jgi:steroid delta-isomerase-like uncharacterized protein
MTREEIAAIVSRRIDAWHRRDIPGLVEDVSEDSVVDSPFAGGEGRGKAGFARAYEAFFQAFPDARLNLQDVLIDGDRVILVGRLSGTDRGGFMGLTPTGRSFDIPIASLYELKDGLIVHERRIYDFTGLLVQVGALKAKPI